MAAPEIGALPTTPSRNNPGTFSSDMDTFLAALPTFRDEVNDFADYINGGLITANILGTVSQSGGNPTGSVFEEGSNANGEYAKFADGLMIPRKTEFVLDYVAGSRVGATWTFPSSFSSDPVVNAIVAGGSVVSGATPNASDLAPVVHNGAGSNSVNLQLYRATGATNFEPGDTVEVDISAIGRWFD